MPSILEAHDPLRRPGEPNLHPDTLAAQALGWVDEATRAIVPALHPSTTFLRDADNQYRSGRVYARADNPSYNQAEQLLTELEHGREALLFASGMAAATACFLALRHGDHVLAPQVMYWSLRNWLRGFAADWGLVVDFVDMTDVAAVQRAIQPGRTRLVWVETPANPLWSVTDIAAVAQAAHAAGAFLAVDSTVASPVLTQPLSLGADVVMHAATKFLNGHSDVVAGALVVGASDPSWPADHAAGADALRAYWQRVRAVRAQLGGILGTFEAWLLLRGMRTLPLRVRAASANAMAVAQHFAHHPQVLQVLYPGLPSDPGHAVASRQMHAGFGGMLSLRVRAGEAAAVAVAAHTRVWKRATSLGGTESLIEHRASVEGAGTPAPADLLRLSAGTEHVDDLIQDLEQALAKGF